MSIASWGKLCRRGSLPALKRLRGHARVAQAAVLLLIARGLVAAVPMRFWRGSLGTIVPQDTPAAARDVPPAMYPIVSAVERATLRLPLHFKCLPRAMAVQWMAHQRGVACTLRIGIDREHEEQLHAWIDCGAVTVIGRVPDAVYVPLMAIAAGHNRPNAR